MSGGGGSSSCCRCCFLRLLLLLVVFTIKTSCEGSAAHDDLSRHVPSTLQPGSATFLKAILSIRAPPFLSFWQAHVCIF